MTDHPDARMQQGKAMTGQDDQEKTLNQWSRRLTQALQVLDFEVDQKLIRELSEQSSQSVDPAAGPVTALIVGYAAGLAATNGKAGAVSAVRSAADVALQLCAEGTESGATGQGWTDTAQ